MLQADISVEMPSIQETAAGFSMPSRSVTDTATESATADGSADNLAHGVGTAPPLGFGASVFDLDVTVVLETGCDLCEAAFQEVVTVQRLLIQVTASNVISKTDSAVDGVIEGVTADGSTDVRAHYASTALICGPRPWHLI